MTGLNSAPDSGLMLVFLPADSTHGELRPLAAKARSTASSGSRQAGLGISAGEKVKPPADVAPESSALILVLPSTVDWGDEASKVARKQVDVAEKGGIYRDLAGLSAQQKAWLRRTQIKAVPHNTFWDNASKSRLMFPGGFYITDDCVIINFLPACEMKLERRKARGDLFQDMKKYLDEIDDNPLP
jgi:hypothetical protein